jgi:hypothetical protein
MKAASKPIASKERHPCLFNCQPYQVHLEFANLRRLDNTVRISSVFAYQNYTSSVLDVKKNHVGPTPYIERFGSLTRAVALGRVARQRDGRVPGDHVYHRSRSAG